MLFCPPSIRVVTPCDPSSVATLSRASVFRADCSSASIRAASSKAGLSMKSPACSCAAMKESTSRRSASSPAHARSRKARRSSAFNSSARSRSGLIARHLSGLILAGFISARFIFVSSTEFVIEPRPGRVPLAYDRAAGDLESFCGLFRAQPAEEPQFDYAALARIDFGQRVERFVERYQIWAALRRDGQRFVERNVLRLAPVR